MLNDSKKFINEQTHLIFHAAPAVAISHLIIVAFLYPLVSEIVDTTLLTLWSVVIAFLAIAKCLLYLVYKKSKPSGTKSWLNTFTVLTLLTGMAWASFTLLYLTVEDTTYKVIFLALSCGIVASEAPALSAWTPSYYANVVPHFLSIIFILTFSSEPTSYYLVIAFILFYAMLSSVQRRAHKNILHNYQLQHKNDELVESLNAEIVQREKIIAQKTHEAIGEHQRFQALLEGVSAISVQGYDENRQVTFWNEASEHVYGYSQKEALGKQLEDLIIPENMRNAVISAHHAWVKEGIEIPPSELKLLHKNRSNVDVLSSHVMITKNNGSKEMFCVDIDITARKKAEDALQLSARVFSDTHEGITITDANKIIIDVNPAFCEITGYSRAEIIGENPRILSSGKQSPEFYRDMWQQIDKSGYWQGEVWNRKKNGELYAELLTISSLRNEDDIVVNYIGVFSDITRSKRQQEQLSLMAHYDVLTGLPNRTLFSDRFNQAVLHNKRSQALVAVCFLDLDNFKSVNDSHGHEMGDQLLVEVSKRISEHLREEDTVSRQGGDEFAIILTGLQSISQSQELIKRVLESLSEPFRTGQETTTITASCGITLYPLDEGDIDTLLRHADQAMYKAKLEGKNCIQLYNSEHDQLTIQKHHHLEEIDLALTNNEFQLYYQPKVNMRTGHVFGVEALIRWNHPEKGLIPPLDFLPILEGTELELTVGNWVMNEALKQLEVWNRQGITIEISINISSAHLLSKTFFSDLEAALTQHSTVDSQCLQIEILESSALGDLTAITAVIEACQRNLGVKAALDDFGTGYSSLTHLRSLPADIIKIDQTFVRDMIDDPSDFAIIDGIIGLAESFGREVIAEGVETTNHGLMLLVMGCEEAQGYGIARPMPARDYPQWLNDYTPNKAWLNYGNKHRTIKENKLTLFTLITNHWKNSFVDNIQSSPEDIDYWPIMDNARCPCGSWIKRAIKEELFESESLKLLHQTHNALHLVAQTIHQHYHNGDINSAREGLADLHEAFEKMTNALEMCK